MQAMLQAEGVTPSQSLRWRLCPKLCTACRQQHHQLKLGSSLLLCSKQLHWKTWAKQSLLCSQEGTLSSGLG